MTEPMTALRRRMIDDMAIRNMSPRIIGRLQAALARRHQTTTAEGHRTSMSGLPMKQHTLVASRSIIGNRHMVVPNQREI